MKSITEDLKDKLCSSHFDYGESKSIKWNDIYDTEQELIQDLFNNKVHTDEDNVPDYQICKGYAYIKSLRQYYLKYKELTEKQMKQLKRLAYEIAYHIYVE